MHRPIDPSLHVLRQRYYIEAQGESGGRSEGGREEGSIVRRYPLVEEAGRRSVKMNAPDYAESRAQQLDFHSASCEREHTQAKVFKVHYYQG